MDEIIRDICTVLKTSSEMKIESIKPCVDDKILLFANTMDPSQKTLRNESLDTLTELQNAVFWSDRRSVIMRLVWTEVATITIRFEFRTEYFTSTIFVDLAPTLPIGEVDETSGEIRWNLSELRKHFKDLAGTPGPKLDGLKRYFFSEFWETFALQIFPKEELESYRSDPLLARTFADFRGLIVSDETMEYPYVDVGHFAWGNNLEAKLLPLVTQPDLSECTAAYMLSGRALYMSTLVSQTEGPLGLRIPLTYVVYVHQRTVENVFPSKPLVTKWQLGRLIDRIHLLGSVRLAALRDLRPLRQAGDSLAGLEALITTARDAVSPNAEREDAEQPATGEVRPTPPLREHQDTLRLIQVAQRHFNQIGSTYFDQTNSDTGLMYRVERSRYYVAQFRSSIPSLRLGRLEGYQRYDEFVDRRFGAYYDYIDRLGRRYERASDALRTLYQNYLAVRSNKTGQQIEELQRFAEAALIGVLVPYYIVSSMAHLGDAPHPLSAEHNGPSVTQAFSVVFLTMFPGITIYRLQVKSKSVRRRLGYAALMVVVASIFWTLIYNNPRVIDLISLIRRLFDHSIASVMTSLV
jgi:hypothetical protein